MGLSIQEELRRTFERATMRREAKHLTTPWQWARVTDLTLRAQIARERETRLFRERYDTRVEAARRRLIDAAATPTRTLEPDWARLDRFNAADLLRQAQREVRAHHERRLTSIDDAEARILFDIIRQADGENNLRGMAKAELNRVVDLQNYKNQQKKNGPIQD